MDARPTEFGADDAGTRFPELLARAEGGETITIRRDGRAVARLVPVKHHKTLEERRAAHETYLAWVQAHGPTLGPDLTIKQLIDEGRDVE